MKIQKPYLSLTKNTKAYELGVTLTTAKDQMIIGVRQQEVTSGDQPYWGVIITVADGVPMVNGPENPIFSATVDIALDKSESYQKILCSTEIGSISGDIGVATGDSTPIDFSDGNNG